MRIEDRSKGKKPPASRSGNIQHALTHRCSREQEVWVIKMSFMLSRPKANWEIKRKRESCKFRTAKTKKKKRVPGVYVAHHMTFDTVTRIIERAAEGGGGGGEGILMGPCERPLTVAEFDSHLLSESICYPTVPKWEAAPIPGEEPVPRWSFVHVCLSKRDGLWNRGATNPNLRFLRHEMRRHTFNPRWKRTCPGSLKDHTAEKTETHE